MTEKNSKREKIYHYLDSQALPIIQEVAKSVIRKDPFFYQGRFCEDELVNAAFCFYRKRCIDELKKADEGLLRSITRAFLQAYVMVNNFPLKIPGGTVTKKGMLEEVKEILAPLRENEIFYEDNTMKRDLKLDYETLLEALPQEERIAMISMLYGHHRKFTASILKNGFEIKNPYGVIKEAVHKFKKMFSNAGYP